MTATRADVERAVSGRPGRRPRNGRVWDGDRASLRPARRLRSLAGRSTGDRRASAGALKRGRHHARARVQAAPER